jgi:hypothetical protein
MKAKPFVCPVVYADGDKCRALKQFHSKAELNEYHSEEKSFYKFHPKYHGPKSAPKKPKAKPRKPKAKESDLGIGFDRGILAALYIVDFCDPKDSSRIYHEIAKSNCPADLWATAKKYDREHLARHGFKPPFIRKGSR